jgi:hypothetical protein
LGYFPPKGDFQGITAQLAVIGKYLGKSIAFIRNKLFLLRLPGKTQQAIWEEKIGLFQGYLCAGNITYLSVLTTPLLPVMLHRMILKGMLCFKS